MSQQPTKYLLAMSEDEWCFPSDDSSTGSSISHLADPSERTPLLLENPRKTRTPIPKARIATLLFLQLSEPVTSQSIYPFINELIKNLDVIKGDERKAGYYAGLLESLFFAAEATTVLFWSRLSDLVGRRPVLLVGFIGLSISMICFGLSKTYSSLVFSRCLAGFLNGYSGVIKSMMGEATDSSNMAQAFAYIPVVWSVGATIGPFIGGELAHPADRFPQIFGDSRFWESYPYLLPCLISAIFPLISLAVIFLSVKSTPKVRMLRKSSDANHTPELSSFDSQNISGDDVDSAPTLRSVLTHRVLVAVLNYALLSLIDIAFIAIQPLFYSTSIPVGGLGLSPPTIGMCLGLYGLFMGTFQVFFFARFHDWLGPKKLLILTLFTNIPIFALFPFINLLAKSYGMSAITWFAVCFQLCLCVFSDMSGGCAFIFVTLSAPNKQSLGTTNGIVAAVTAAIHAIGPVATTSLFAASIEHDLLHSLLVYVILISIVIVALLAASLLPADDDEWEYDETF